MGSFGSLCLQLHKRHHIECCIYIYTSIFFVHLSMAVQPFVGPSPLVDFRNLFYTNGRTPWTGDQPVARPLPTHRTTQAQNKRTQTPMPQMGFEPTMPVFEWAKTVHALDRAATVIGWSTETFSRAITSKMAYRRVSQDMLWKLLVQNFLEDGLTVVIQGTWEPWLDTA
jgi:hypothetical protein